MYRGTIQRTGYFRVAVVSGRTYPPPGLALFGPCRSDTSPPARCDLTSLAPGGLFEIALAVWLVARGLNPSFEFREVRP